MNVVIVEDEELTARRLEKLLGQYDPSIRVVARLTSVAKAVDWFTQSASATPPDLVFMDIHLEDDIAFRIIDQTHLTVPVIFTTAFDEYALRAFKANSIDYLLKPIDEDELAAAIDKFKAVWPTDHAPQPAQPDYEALLSLMTKPGQNPYKTRFMASVGPKLRSIRTGEIAYFFFKDKATWLTTREGQHLSVEYSIDKLTSLLDPAEFFRINRAFVVSLDAIQTIHTYSGSKIKLVLKPAASEDVFVSGDRVTPFKEWLGK